MPGTGNEIWDRHGRGLRCRQARGGRDRARARGHEKALEILKASDNILSKDFGLGNDLSLPCPRQCENFGDIGDGCEFSMEQLRWLRGKSIIYRNTKPER